MSWSASSLCVIEQSATAQPAVEQHVKKESLSEEVARIVSDDWKSQEIVANAIMSAREPLRKLAEDHVAHIMESKHMADFET